MTALSLPRLMMPPPMSSPSTTWTSTEVAGGVSPSALFQTIEPPAVAASQERMDRSYAVALLSGRADPMSRAFSGRVASIDNGDGISGVSSQPSFEGVLSGAQDLQSRGRYEEALQGYRQAVSMDHTDRPIARFLYAAALTRDMRASSHCLQALQELEKAQKEIEAGSLGERGQAFLALIHHEKAQNLYRLDREAESMPEFQAAQQMLKALSFRNARQKEVLSEVLSSALRAGLWVVSLFDFCGYSDLVHDAMGAELKACELTQNFRGEAKIFFELGFMDQSKGNFRNAVGHYEDALSALADAGDEGLPTGGPVEQTNWAPFLRLMLGLCDIAVSPQTAANDLSAVDADIARLGNARHGGMGLKHAFGLVFSLASYLMNAPMQSSSVAEECLFMARSMLERIVENDGEISLPEYYSKSFQIDLWLGLLSARNGRILDARKDVGYALLDSLRLHWEKQGESFRSSHPHIRNALDDFEMVIDEMAVGSASGSETADQDEIERQRKNVLGLFQAEIPGFPDPIRHPEVSVALSLIQQLKPR